MRVHSQFCHENDFFPLPPTKNNQFTYNVVDLVSIIDWLKCGCSVTTTGQSLCIAGEQYLMVFEEEDLTICSTRGNLTDENYEAMCTVSSANQDIRAAPSFLACSLMPAPEKPDAPWEERTKNIKLQSNLYVRGTGESHKQHTWWTSRWLCTGWNSIL